MNFPIPTEAKHRSGFYSWKNRGKSLRQREQERFDQRQL
jgi:hypothetical protein